MVESGVCSIAERWRVDPRLRAGANWHRRVENMLLPTLKGPEFNSSLLKLQGVDGAIPSGSCLRLVNPPKSTIQHLTAMSSLETDALVHMSLFVVTSTSGFQLHAQPRASTSRSDKACESKSCATQSVVHCIGVSPIRWIQDADAHICWCGYASDDLICSSLLKK